MRNSASGAKPGIEVSHLKRKRVLSDHKQVGKKLIPPLLQYGNFQEVSWANTMIPEFSWLALIHAQHGDTEGVRLITAIARAARVAGDDASKKLFASASDYSCLSPSAWSAVREKLPERDLGSIRDAIESLIALYGECPLRQVFELPPQPSGNVDQISDAVKALFRRRDRFPMMVQATAIWLGIDSGALPVNPHSSLANFPEIENYPETELSREVGSFIRATLNGLVGTGLICPPSQWAPYFWNRGLEISECRFADS